MNIIQIGCHIGNDHVYDYVSQNYCQNIILIDANPYVIETCKEKYKNISNTKFLNYAIVPQSTDNNSITFYIPKQDLISAHCSTSLEFLHKHNHHEYIEKNVPSITLNNLFNQLNLNHINRLYIDAEGLDAQIIIQLNFNNLNIDYILFEHTHSDGAFSKGDNFNQAIDKLQNLGYKIQDNDFYNIGFIKT